MLKVEITMYNENDIDTELNQRFVEVQEGKYALTTINDFIRDSLYTWLDSKEIVNTTYVFEYENPAMLIEMEDGTVFNIGANYQDAEQV
jgi:hypothetical protein